MFSILVCEDDFAIKTMISTKLKQENYSVYTAQNGQEALNLMEKQQIDLVISDIMMPEMDGYEFVQILRETKYTLPILMITAKSQLESLEEAFKLGVDDYMVKPLRLEELVLRVKALLRRSQLEAEKVLTFTHTRLDYNALTMTDLTTGEQVQIPPKEFFLLYKLLSHPEKIFTRLDLLDDIWGMEEDYDERLVDACIKRIRQKLKGNEDFDIVTVRGLGYKGTIKHG
ncbi:response regulator transcription factor [Granulicatella elegans]|uniref:response regulator transcription factor n=1 Tax=Granulicatella elegans TaxID=137732 RepID=UPI00061D9FBA|nr:response regulator transcription factor [Granulicatella elegans]UEA30786.1 response regulator transcription factor [Granulicatella elegans]